MQLLRRGLHSEQLVRGNSPEPCENTSWVWAGLGKNVKIASFKESFRMSILSDSGHVPWQRQGSILPACGHVSEMRICQ